MKTHYLFIGLVVFFSSCDFGDSEKGKLTGTQSEIGATGATFALSATGISGVSNMQASVTKNTDGISSINGTATLTNSMLTQVIKAIPGTLSQSGNVVTLNDLKVKFKSDGVEKVNGINPGVLVNYNSSVGDVYAAESSKTKREVTAKTTTDSYDWGGMKIKTMEVTESINAYGIKSMQYIANHKWGIVGILITFDDNSTIKIPVNSSKSN